MKKILITLVLLLSAFFLVGRTIVNGQTPTTGLSQKCNCGNKTYNTCGDYFGLTDIKYRGPCLRIATGPHTCNARVGTSYYQYQSCGGATPTVTGGPTATPTTPPNQPWSINPVNPGTVDLCQAMTLSDTNLKQGESLTVTSTSSNSDIISFGWWLYNMDNLDNAGKPKPIKFVSGTTKVAGVIKTKEVAGNDATLTIDFADVNRKDFNWNYYMPRPKRIRVDGYFKKTGTTAWSKFDSDCSKVFNAATNDPTPTPNPNCKCNTSNSCTTACFFDKYTTGVTYAGTIKCNAPGSYSSDPTAAQKNQFCQNYLRTKGDANGDGKVTILDYFYYAAGSVFGAKLPPITNIDFNGDGSVSSADKTILMKTLKP